MTNHNSYYQNLSADYSKPELIAPQLAKELLRKAETYLSQREVTLPKITSEYSLEHIEQENKDWWPTHCETLRQGRGEILTNEYAEDYVYFCADGPFFGKVAATNREANWWAILAQPYARMTWPIVMFRGEVIYCEWNCFDERTNELISKGNETWLRRGHRGACYLKCAQINFCRHVYAPDNLLHWLRR